MHTIESEGKTIAEAVESALSTLGLRREQVEVLTLQESSSGFLGMGAKPARVRVTQKLRGEPSAHQPAARAGSRPAPRRESPRPAAAAGAPQACAPSVDTAKSCAQTQELLSDLLRLMDFQPKLSTPVWDPVQERVRCSIEGPDADRLLAEDGQALAALQFLVTLIVGRRVGAPVAVQVDASGFWDKREKNILAQAQRGVDEVRSTGRPCRLAPMDPSLRRLVHRSLMNHPDVETASEGEGAWRKIVIRPRKR